uniref:Transmembrane protein n=1 Tax=Rhodosorus marinus TaxID=101924 RepID=A0A7S3ELW6_9RHOD|mmetsp:Transcript_43048/g.168517  ORF Transcript_43048/g.168517 Transcript_43048/m.168517 type:complete len:563 (+) Transcript_43048:316-2004(+)
MLTRKPSCVTHDRCWCAQENVLCSVPQGLVSGSEKIVCGGYDDIDEKHCRFEYDLHNPSTKFAVVSGEPWKVDVEYGSAGTDGKWFGGGMPRTQADLFNIMMRLTSGFGGRRHSMHRSMYSGRRGWGSGNGLFFGDPFKAVLNQAFRLGTKVSGHSGIMNGFGRWRSGFHKKKSHKAWSKPRSPRGGYSRRSTSFFSFKGIMLCIGLFVLTSKYLGPSRNRANSRNPRRGEQGAGERSGENGQDNIQAGDQNEEGMSSSQTREAHVSPSEDLARGEESSRNLTGEDQQADVIGGETPDTQSDQADGVESLNSETQVDNEQESARPSPDDDPEFRPVQGITRFWRKGGFFNLLVFLSVFEIVSVLLRTGKLYDLVLGLSLTFATYKFVATKMSLAVWEAVGPSIETAFARALEKLKRTREWTNSVLGDAKEKIAERAEVVRDYISRNQAYASTAGRRAQSFLESQRQQLSVGLAEMDVTTIAAAVLACYVVYQVLYRFVAWELMKLVGLVAVAYFAYQLIESGSTRDGPRERVDREGSNASFNTEFRGFSRRTGGFARHRRRW